MTATQDATLAELQRTIAELRREREAGLAREATLAEELTARDAALAQRNTEYRERIEHQAATVDVLKAMSASPDDPQPVFDLIVERARDLCDAHSAGVYGFDGTLVQLRAATGVENDPERLKAFTALYPRPPTRDFHPGRAILDRKIVRIDDVESDPGLNPLYRGFTNQSGVAVPLLLDGVAIGALGLGRRERGGFSDSQVALLQTFAEQAVIAIGSAETYRNLHEALEQQTATAEVLQVINASPGNLMPVFDAILDKAHALCGATMGSLSILDGTALRRVATHGLSAASTAVLGQPHHLKPEFAARLLDEGSAQYADIRLLEDDTNAQLVAQNDGVRTIVWVPLRKDPNLLGWITAYRTEIRPFSERQIALLKAFAAQAVIAMENARLLTETQEALEQQTATAEVLRVINASPGILAPVFDAMLEWAMRLLGAEFGLLYTRDGDGLHLAAQRGVPAAFAALRSKRPPVARPGDAIYRLYETNRPIHVLDLTAEYGRQADNAGQPAVAELGGARTLLMVPLLKDGTALGHIGLYRQEVQAFSDKQITLLENFAAQAVIAMENARLITEQREALEQQTATAEVLQVINASPGNLVPVFEAMLEKATRLCEAPFGNLRTWDGERFHFGAVSGDPQFSDWVRRRGPLLPHRDDDSPLGRIIKGEQVVRFTVAPGDEDHWNSAGFKEMVAVSGMRSGILVALKKDEAILGTISVYRQEVRPFSDKQVALLENFAAQAVIAMENARLITEQREALEQQTATAEVLQVINSLPGDLTPVFDAILEKAHSLCGVALGELELHEGGKFRAVAMRGVSGPLAELLRQPLTPSPNSPLARLLAGEPVVQIADLFELAQQRPDDRRTQAGAQYGLRTVLFVPLRKDDALLGYITAYRQEVRPFSEKEIALLKNFAAQAVIAMENARLITETQEALEQQTATAEVLQVINSSPGDLAPVFDAMLQKATDLCDAAFGILWTFDGEHYHAAAFRNVPPAYSEFLHDPPPATPLTPLGRIAAGEAFAQIADMADEIFAAGGPLFHRAVDLAGFRTIVGVALRKDAVLLGAITIYRQEVRPFSDKQVVLLQNFAAQAVVAMENARLLDEIRQRQEELRVTFENMGDGVAMFDETQHLVAWNRKFQDILDVPDDIIARRQTFSEYVNYLADRGEYGSEADPEEHVRRLIGQAGQSRTYERIRPDGRVIEIRHNPVPGGGFVLIYADITERKRSEAEIRAARDAAEEASRTIEAAYRELKTAQANLIQAEKMASLGQLTAGIAHEIKNPLNFVNNFAALSVDLLSELKETAGPGFAALTEKQRAEVEDVSAMLTSNLEKITEHGQRADGIVKAMLEHSRGSSGERRIVDLNALIDEALNLAYHGARAQDQSFNITLERDFKGIAPIEVNPQDITRVFLNLFSNGFYAVTRRARDGADAGFEPTLKVTTRDASDALEIRVRDNGNGIPTDIRDKLFQPFFTTKPTGEGTGLGLSITYDIVTQQHGGTIAVDSKVGDYSEFTIRLPRYP